MEFLVGSGFVVFFCNAMIVAFLHARAQAAVEGIQLSHQALQQQREQEQQSTAPSTMINKERRTGIAGTHNLGRETV